MKNRFNFGRGNNFQREHFQIFSNKPNSNYYDYLVFLDSKGYCLSNPKVSWIFRLAEKIDNKNKSYLIITRPKELTIFFSLINFVMLNNIKYKNLITNVGFVDLTPKKINYIRDIIDQNPFKNISIKTKFLTDYFDENSKNIKLYNIIICEKLINLISSFISDNFNQIFLIKTFEFKSSIKVERKRPDCFYSLLKETNVLLSNISMLNSNIIEVEIKLSQIKDFSKISYDAVHFTEFGHKYIGRNLKIINR